MLPLPDGPDPQGLAEFSVVYTDRALNHMSKKFQGIMCDLHAKLVEIYNGQAAVLVPGGGSCAMEAAARQFVGPSDRVLILRNGFFSFRWSQIFERQQVAEAQVMKARPGAEGVSFSPAPIEEVEAAIRAASPAVIFAPHVETSAGIMLPDDYIRRLGVAAREVNALFVLDGIAAGVLAVDLEDLGVDVYLTSTQKGWSAMASTGVLILGPRALARLESTTSSTFCLDLKAWHNVMKAYLAGGHAYHVTLATDAIVNFHEALSESLDFGLRELQDRQWQLGRRVRALLAGRGLLSVAAPGFEAPTVVVVHTTDAGIAQKFAAAGVQIAAGVPLMIDHGTNSISDSFRTFRFGLFGLDKWQDVDYCLERLVLALDAVLEPVEIHQLKSDGAGLVSSKL